MVKPNVVYARERRDRGLCGSCGNLAVPGKTSCAGCAKKISERAKARYLAKKAQAVCTLCTQKPQLSGKTCCQECLDKQRAASAARRLTKRSQVHKQRRELLAKLQSAGICYRCQTAVAIKGLLVCESCRTNPTDCAFSPVYYDQRKAAGLCQSCDNKVTDHVRCPTCRQKRKLRRQQFIDNGICSLCGNEKAASGKKRCESCLAARKKEYEDRKAAGLCAICGKQPPMEGIIACAVCRPKLNAKLKRRDKRYKDAAFKAYGGYKCACCGETEPSTLELDHINNDGNVHRKQMTGKNSCGNQIHWWLKKHKYPPIMQVLCASCHTSKTRLGECHHKRNR